MGRMGRAILGILKEGPHGFSLSGAVEASGHPLLSRDAFEAAGVGKAGVPVTDDFAKAIAGADLAIDFTGADSSARNAGAAAAAGKPIVIGSTGLGPAHMERIRNAAAKVAIVQSPNMSVGVNLMFKVAADVARVLARSTTWRSSRRTTGSRKTPPRGRRFAWPTPWRPRSGGRWRTRGCTGGMG